MHKNLEHVIILFFGTIPASSTPPPSLFPLALSSPSPTVHLFIYLTHLQAATGAKAKLQLELDLLSPALGYLLLLRQLPSPSFPPPSVCFMTSCYFYCYWVASFGLPRVLVPHKFFAPLSGSPILGMLLIFSSLSATANELISSMLCHLPRPLLLPEHWQLHLDPISNIICTHLRPSSLSNLLELHNRSSSSD